MTNIEKLERFTKRAKTWNMVLLIIMGLVVLLGIAGLPATLNPQLPDLTGFPEETVTYTQQLFESQNSLTAKAYSVVVVLFNAVILVGVFLNNRRLNKEQNVFWWPYWLVFALTVVKIIYTLFFTPQVEFEGQDLGMITTIVAAVMVLLGSLFSIVPSIVTMLSLRKMKMTSEELTRLQAEKTAETSAIEETELSDNNEDNVKAVANAEATTVETVTEEAVAQKTDDGIEKNEVVTVTEIKKTPESILPTRSKQSRFSKKQKIFMGIGGALVALLVVGGAVWAYVANQSATNASIPTYSTEAVTMADPLTFNGMVVAETTSEVYLDATKGSLSEVLVADGQEVTAGTPLLSYQSQELADQVKTSEQQLSSLNLQANNARSTLQSAQTRKNELQSDLTTARNKYNAADANSVEGQATRQEQQVLIDQYTDAISAQDDAIQQAQQAVDAANLEVSNATSNLDELRGRVASQVTAEIDGVVVLNEAGKTSATVPVIQIVSHGTKVEGTVSEYDYSRINVGATVTVRTNSNDQNVSGTIMQVNLLPEAAAAAAAAATSTTSSTANYTFTVKPETDLQYGYSCQISLPINELRLSATAVMTEDNQQYVYKVVDGVAERTNVTAEEQAGVMIIREGLAEGDTVISDPDETLTDGQEVTVN